MNPRPEHPATLPGSLTGGAGSERGASQMLFTADESQERESPHRVCRCLARERRLPAKSVAQPMEAQVPPPKAQLGPHPKRAGWVVRLRGDGIQEGRGLPPRE